MKNKEPVTNSHESVTDRNQLDAIEFIELIQKEIQAQLEKEVKREKPHGELTININENFCRKLNFMINDFIELNVMEMTPQKPQTDEELFEYLEKKYPEGTKFTIGPITYTVRGTINKKTFEIFIDDRLIDTSFLFVALEKMKQIDEWLEKNK